MTSTDVRHRGNVPRTGNPGGPVVTPAHGLGRDQNTRRPVVPRPGDRHRTLLFDGAGRDGSGPSAWTRRA